MPRLLRFILLLSFIAGLMILAARLLGSTRPELQLNTIMSGANGVVCDRPCLFGIRPGETNFEQATMILHTHPLTRDAKWHNRLTLQLTKSAEYIAFSLTREKLVDSISLTYNLERSGVPVPGSLVASIYLGEVILAFGNPNIILPENPHFVMGFPTMGIIAESHLSYDYKAFVKPNTPISALMIYARIPCPKSATGFLVHPWMGFTSMRRYQNDNRGHWFSHRFSGVPIPAYAQCHN